MVASLKRALVGALVALALPVPFVALAQPGLNVSLTAQRVAVDARGRESFLPATEAKPGQVVEYRAAYRNPTQASMRDVQATLPIPAGTEYVSSTARPALTRSSAVTAQFPRSCQWRSAARRPPERKGLQPQLPGSLDGTVSA